MKKRPLYQRIQDELQQKILARELAAEARLPSEAEISEQYEVSRITARRALDELVLAGLAYRVQGSGSYVSPAAADPRRSENAATDVRTSDAAVYGLVLPFGGSVGRAIDIVHGAGEYFHSTGDFLSVQISRYDPTEERRILTQLFDRGAGGLILYPYSNQTNLDLLYRLYLENRRIVLIDKDIDGIPFSAVVSDNENGSFEATEYLLSRGHSKIAFVATQSLDASVTIRDRYFGFCRALHEHGLDPGGEPTVFLPGLKGPNADPLEIGTVLDTVLDDANGVTALQAVNDHLAIDIMKAALARGVRIPEELSVIGFDNVEAAAHTEVPLTTVEQDFYGLGYSAAKILHDDSSAEKQMVTLPTRIVERQSVRDLCPKPKSAAS